MSFTYLPKILNNATPISSSYEGHHNPAPTPISKLETQSEIDPPKTAEEVEQILKANEAHSLEKGSKLEWQNNKFLLGQFYYENDNLDDAVSHFKKLVEDGKISGSTVFTCQARYQLAILTFDSQLKRARSGKISEISNCSVLRNENLKEAFRDLQLLLKEIDLVSGGSGEGEHESLPGQDLFKICINYNLGLATFNGYSKYRL